ncbi:MAG TPA: hypothetical protein VK559_03180 [Ferruginibacter sp.]|nr:hypothetical protein [Ferruginibacter sp.]
MKKIILFTAIGLTLFSCKKSTSSTPQVVTTTMTATIDGVSDTFNIDTYAYSEFYVNSDSVHISDFSIQADDPAGDYFDLEAGAYKSDKFLVKTYHSGGDSTTYASGYLEPNGGGYFGDYNTANNPFIVTVTSATSSLIQGTFSGPLYTSEDSTQTAKIVTNGKFTLSRL